MSYDANLLAKPREVVCFVKKESTAGTLVFPSASDAIYVTDIPDLNQQPTYTNSPEIANTLDVIARVKDMMPEGSLSIPVLIRPSGTQGTAPLHDVLFESLMGSKDAQASYVDYNPSLTKDTFSIWWAAGGLCRFAKGCVISAMNMSITNRGYVQATFNGGFMWAGYAGRTTLSSAAAASAQTITVADASRFAVGARIWNVDEADSNSDAGYEVTDVDTSTNQLTISPGIADTGGWAADTEISWFLPDPSPPTSYTVAAKDTTIQIDSVSKTVKTINLNIESPVMFLTDEITTDGYPTAYVEQQRNLRGDVTLNVRPADVAYFRDRDDTVSVVVQFGDTNGRKMKVTFSYASLEIPAVNRNEPVEIRLGWQGLGSSGEDSVAIRFE